jgi:hypothetical protein
MNLRKKSTREEFERALAQCKPEDFDGHTGFIDLHPNNGLNGCVRRLHSFATLKAKRKRTDLHLAVRVPPLPQGED